MDKVLGEGSACCKMEIGEENLPLADKWIFWFEGFFDLEDHICPLPQSTRILKERGPSCFELPIGDTASHACILFNENLMSMGCQG